MVKVKIFKFTRRYKTDPWYVVFRLRQRSLIRRLRYHRLSVFFKGLYNRYRHNFSSYSKLNRLVKNFSEGTFKRQRRGILTSYRGFLQFKVTLKRYFYRLKERQLRRLRSPSSSVYKYNTIYQFERRLNCFLIRSRLFSTPAAVRQHILHGRVLVNFTVVDKPGFFLSMGDKITFVQSLSNLLKLKRALLLRLCCSTSKSSKSLTFRFLNHLKSYPLFFEFSFGTIITYFGYFGNYSYSTIKFPVSESYFGGLVAVSRKKL